METEVLKIWQIPVKTTVLAEIKRNQNYLKVKNHKFQKNMLPNSLFL